MPNPGPSITSGNIQTTTGVETANLSNFSGTATQLIAQFGSINIYGNPIVVTTDVGPMYWTGSSWIQGTGPAGPTGPTGPQGVAAFSVPNIRTLIVGTAYQATNPAKPAFLAINLNSTASLSLAVGTTNTANVVMGPTTAVATGSGVVAGQYANSLTGTLIVGLGISTASGYTAAFALPAGYYFAIVQTAGTVVITSAFDQSVG